MTVEELIEKLQTYDPLAKVAVCTDDTAEYYVRRARWKRLPHDAVVIIDATDSEEVG